MFRKPLVFCALSSFDCTGDHDVPPYVFADIGPFSSSYSNIESIVAVVLYLNSSMYFFSNYIQDLYCYLL